MESITNQKGMLSLELGTSWISLNEAAALEKGDTIRLNSFTGIPHKLMFNNLFMGSCEIVILGDIMGVRITDFVRRPERTSPGNKSFLTSRLPLAVRIGAASYSLEELEGLIPGSIISLDCPYRERTEAVLYAGGIKTAEGTVVSLYENYGLRIEKTLFPPSGKQEKEDPGFANRIIKAEMESDFCREYDFRRPDKISRNGIGKIHDIHRNFLKYLKSRNPSLQNWSVSYVAQLALYEITGDLDRYAFRCLDMAESMQLRDKPGSHPRFCEPETSLHPLPDDTINFISEFLLRKNPPALCQICYPPASQLKTEESNMPSLLGRSWRFAADMDFVPMGAREDIYSMKRMNENEMVVLVRLGPEKEGITPGQITEEGVYFVYPFIVLNPIGNLLNL